MTPTTGRAQRRDLALLWHQVRYEQLSFWRNPQSAFFTFVFPVVIITLFGALFHGVGRSSYFYGLSALQYYVPTIAAVSVLGACYSQLAIVLSTRRQNGILKRIRATPLPGPTSSACWPTASWSAWWTSCSSWRVGRLFGVPLPSHWAAIAVALVLGAACFCALGVAVASPIRNAEAAPAVVPRGLFPLAFISGTYLLYPLAGDPAHHRDPAGAAVQRRSDGARSRGTRGSTGPPSASCWRGAWSAGLSRSGGFRWDPRGDLTVRRGDRPGRGRSPRPGWRSRLAGPPGCRGGRPLGKAMGGRGDERLPDLQVDLGVLLERDVPGVAPVDRAVVDRGHRAAGRADLVRAERLAPDVEEVPQGVRCGGPGTRCG